MKNSQSRCSHVRSKLSLPNLSANKLARTQAVLVSFFQGHSTIWTLDNSAIFSDPLKFEWMSFYCTMCTRKEKRKSSTMLSYGAKARLECTHPATMCCLLACWATDYYASQLVAPGLMCPTQRCFGTSHCYQKRSNLVSCYQHNLKLKWMHSWLLWRFCQRSKQENESINLSRG